MYFLIYQIYKIMACGDFPVYFIPFIKDFGNRRTNMIRFEGYCLCSLPLLRAYLFKKEGLAVQKTKDKKHNTPTKITKAPKQPKPRANARFCRVSKGFFWLSASLYYFSLKCAGNNRSFRVKCWRILCLENLILLPGAHAASASSRCSLSEIFPMALFQSFALQALLFHLFLRHYCFLFSYISFLPAI